MNLPPREKEPFDTSEILTGENYRGKVREVALWKGRQFNTFQETLDYAVQQGYQPYDLGIVNVTYAGLAKNELRAVLLLFKEGRIAPTLGSCLGGGLLAREGKGYRFYELGKDFSFIV